MTISVNVFNQAEIKEDQTTEFKRSIFIDPETHNPGFRQMMTIAETLAAFMNADGGFLFVGISDDKKIFGIESDLALLKTQAQSVVARSARGNDETFDYDDSTDKYELKIRAIVKAYLSPNASGYLGVVKFAKMGEKLVCRIEARKCKPDDYVYAYRKYGPARPEIAEIYKRFGNQKRKLEGAERDEFVRERTRQQVLANVNAVVAQDPKGLVEQVIVAINRAFAAQPQIVGASVQVEGAVALDDPNFAVLTSPKGFVFDGKHVRDVKSWKDCYLALLEKLNELDPVKFGALPDQADFKKSFIHPVPHKKYGRFYPGKFGQNGDVRAFEVPGKAYFTVPHYIVHRLLAHFGVEPDRVMVRA